MSPDVLLVDLAAVLLIGFIAWYFQLVKRR